MRAASLNIRGFSGNLLLTLVTAIAFNMIPLPAVANEKVDNQRRLTLDDAIKVALEQDVWQSSNLLSQQALLSDSVSAGVLPNPKLNAALANIPTDTLDFNQEAMSQLVVGISQMFPRGDTLSLKQQKIFQMSEQYPFMREDRQARVVLNVTQLWMDTYKASQSIALIHKDRALFDQLVDLSLASYSAAMARTQQQDVVRAELELTRIEDRLTQLQQQKEMFEEQLGEWLRPAGVEGKRGEYSKGEPIWASRWAASIEHSENGLELSAELPHLTVLAPWRSDGANIPSDQTLADYFVRHPVVLALDKTIDAQHTDVEIAEQKYKPEWGISANYGYRGSDAIGKDRADLFSVGVTLDMPLFSTVSQDNEVKAATARREAMKIDRHLLLRKMISAFNAAQAQQVRLEQRQQLYSQRLLPQMHQQAQAALNAYRADNGDFSEVVRARIAELNAKIDALALNVDQQKVIAQLNYFLTQHNATATDIGPLKQMGAAE